MTHLSARCRILYILVLLWTCAVPSSYGQTAQEADSLFRVAALSDSDSLKCDLIGYASGYYWSQDLDTALYLLDQAMELCHKVNYKEIIYKHHYRYASVYYYMGHLDSSLQHINYGLSAMRDFDDSRFRAGFYNIESLIHQDRGEYQKALEVSFKSLEMWKEQKDSLNIYSQYHNIAGLYGLILNFEEAIKYVNISIDGFRKENDKYSLAQALVTLSRFLGEAKGYLDPERRSVLDEAMAIGHELGSNDILGSAYTNKGSEYYYAKDFEKAIEVYSKALGYHELVGGQFKIFQCKRILGELYSELGDYQRAEEYYSSLINNPVYSTDGEAKKDLYFELSQHYARTNNYKKAYEYVLQHSQIIDTLYNTQLAEFSEEMDTKYQVKESEEQIAQQQLEIAQQNSARQRILLGSLIGLLSLSGIYLFYSQRQKRKQQEAEHDLQLEKERADSLKELDQLKTQFFTNISHELRTPLTLITDPLRNVLSDQITDHSREDISLAYRNSQKLLNMVNEIMDLSKLEAGQVKVSTHDVLLTPTVRRQLFAFESLAKGRDINLQYSSDLPEDVAVSVDPQHLEKIINNMISNAIKFSPDQSDINVTISHDDKDISVSVSDQGPGIHPNDQDKIFDRFYQAEHSEGMQGGTGVGLALSKNLAHLMHGDITVRSTVGQGSTFTLRIPNDTKVLSSVIDAGVSDSMVIEKQYTSLMINGHQPKVLIIEDNEEMSQYLQKILERDYRCTIAPNGIVGLQKIQKETFDLILSDVMMPGMDGFALREAVLKMDRQHSTPYVFLTARSLDEDVLTGLRLGVDDYITKPFRSEELLARVHNLISNKIGRQDCPAEETPLDSENIRNLKRAESLVFQNMKSTDYSVTDLAKDMAISPRQLNRIIKGQTGMTSVGFILELRLQKARQLIEQNIYNSLTDVRYEVGLDSASYFSRKFKQRYGVAPSELS